MENEIIEQQQDVTMPTPPVSPIMLGGQAISKALAQVNAVVTQPRTPAVGHFKNKYAPLEEILGVLKQPLADAELSVQQHISPDSQYLITEVRHINNESHTTYYPLMIAAKSNRAPHFELQSVATYARRYALMMIFGLCGDEDEGEGLPKEPTKTKDQKKQPLSPPADGETLQNIINSSATTTTEEDF